MSLLPQLAIAGTVGSKQKKTELKINLNFKEKLKYYKITLIFIFIGLWCLTSEIENFNFEIYEIDTLGKIGIAFITVGILNLIYLQKNLYYLKSQFKIKKDEFKNRLLKIAEENKWEIIEINSNYYILKTNRYEKFERNDFLKKNYSERIYIKIDKKKIYFKSVNDFDSDIAIRISNGENQLNEKLIRKILMPAANIG